VRRAAVTLTVTACLLALAAAPAAAGGRSIGAALRAATPAGVPFPGLTATHVHVGGRLLAVVLARTEDQRSTGLRQRSTLEPYDGMLFVFPSDISTAFTMSTVPVGLDIAFYRADGRSVGQLRMQPCAGTEAACPTYDIHKSFRYALETLVGRLPKGRLGG
jgi:uncharacterized membrane protein (UPF0127 family)